MKKKVPRISVILPFYNAAKYLHESVASIQRQSETDWEMIAVDDGSNDGSGKIFEKMMAGDERLQLYRQKNQGVSAARNLALQKVRGELVAFMDADDVAHPERLAKQARFLEENPEVVMVGSWIRYDHGEVVRLPVKNEEIKAALLFVDNVIWQPTVMWRRDFFAQNNLQYDPKFLAAGDFELWTRVIEKGQIYNLPEVLLTYRQHEGQITVQKQVIQQKNAGVVSVRTIKKLLPKLDEQRALFYLNFLQRKTTVDLREIDEWLEEIALANERQEIYQEEILRRVLANKYLSWCSSEAKNLRGEAWQCWQNSRWRKYYRGDQRRVIWFFSKCFLLP